MTLLMLADLIALGCKMANIIAFCITPGRSLTSRMHLDLCICVIFYQLHCALGIGAQARFPTSIAG